MIAAYMGGCGCLTEARVSFCLTLSICPVNCAEVDSLIPRDLRLVLSVFWLISGFAMFKKGVNKTLIFQQKIP